MNHFGTTPTREEPTVGGKKCCICLTVGGLLLKMLKCFEVILNIFEFSHVKEVVES